MSPMPSMLLHHSHVGLALRPPMGSAQCWIPPSLEFIQYFSPNRHSRGLCVSSTTGNFILEPPCCLESHMAKSNTMLCCWGGWSLQGGEGECPCGTAVAVGMQSWMAPAKCGNSAQSYPCPTEGLWAHSRPWQVQLGCKSCSLCTCVLQDSSGRQTSDIFPGSPVGFPSQR